MFPSQPGEQSPRAPGEGGVTQKGEEGRCQPRKARPREARPGSTRACAQAGLAGRWEVAIFACGPTCSSERSSVCWLVPERVHQGQTLPLSRRHGWEPGPSLPGREDRSWPLCGSLALPVALGLSPLSASLGIAAKAAGRGGGWI